LLQQLGSGGSGVVFRARDTAGSGFAAVKLLDLTELRDIQRFEREAGVLASLRHPNIPGYLGHGVAGHGRYYLAEQWIDGPTLREHIEATGLDIDESVALALAVSRALAEVHQRGIVHRDIKPENLVLADSLPAHATLIDFGIARAIAGERLTTTGVMVGTPGYMAPEQASGIDEIDARADLFSLACVVFECVSGHPAFTGQNETAIWTKILLTDPPPLGQLNSDVPAALEALVQQMLEKRPDRRPASAAEVAAALAALPHVDSRRRRHTGAEQATVALRPTARGTAAAAGACVILIAGDDDPRLRERLYAVATPYDVRIERLADGVLAMLVLSGSRSGDVLVDAAECALDIHDALRDRAIVLVASGDAGGAPPLSAAVDWGAAELQTLELEALWSGQLGGVRIHSAAADRLRSRFPIARDAGGELLRRGA
jgi:hypothetical protein